jgi:hypothetical protein
MIYRVSKMVDNKDKDGRELEVGTLRICHGGEKHVWSVSEPAENFHRIAAVSWSGHGGECFDGEQWRLMEGQQNWL